MSRLLNGYQKASEAREQQLGHGEAATPIRNGNKPEIQQSTRRPDALTASSSPGRASNASNLTLLSVPAGRSAADAAREPSEPVAIGQARQIRHNASRNGSALTRPAPNETVPAPRADAPTAEPESPLVGQPSSRNPYVIAVVVVLLAMAGGWSYRDYLASWLFPTHQVAPQHDEKPAPVHDIKPAHKRQKPEDITTRPLIATADRELVAPLQESWTAPSPKASPSRPRPAPLPGAESATAEQNGNQAPSTRYGGTPPSTRSQPQASDRPATRGDRRHRRTSLPSPALPGLMFIPGGGHRPDTQAPGTRSTTRTGKPLATDAGETNTSETPTAGNAAQALLNNTPSPSGNGSRPANTITESQEDTPTSTSAADLLDGLTPSTETPAGAAHQGGNGTTPSAHDLLGENGALPNSGPDAVSGTQNPTPQGDTPTSAQDLLSSLGSNTDSNNAPPATNNQTGAAPGGETPSSGGSGNTPTPQDILFGDFPSSPTDHTPTTTQPGSDNPSAQDLLGDSGSTAGSGGTTPTNNNQTGGTPTGDNPPPSGSSNTPSAEDLLTGPVGRAPADDPQGGSTDPGTIPPPGSDTSPQDVLPGTFDSAAGNDPAPPGTPGNNSSPVSGQPTEEVSDTPADGGYTVSNPLPSDPPSVVSLFPVGAQTPLARTESEMTIAVDLDGAWVVANPLALFTSSADTKTKASADLSDNSLSGHIADAIAIAEILPGDLVARGGPSLSSNRIATIDLASFTRAESLFDQPLGAWAESIGGAGIDRVTLVPLTNDASIDLTWDINRLAVETSPSSALSVMHHVAAITQSPIDGDPSQAVTTLLGFSILSQNGETSYTSYELPGSSAIGDWLASANDPAGSITGFGPSVAVPLTRQFIDPVTHLPGVNVALNVAQYEYSIEAPAVAVRQVAEQAGGVDSGAQVHWDAFTKSLMFDPIPINILSASDQRVLADQFSHDPLIGARIEIDPLLYAGSLDGKDYFLGTEMRVLGANDEVLFWGATPTVVHDGTLYSESGFNLFAPLLSLDWANGDRSSWLDQFGLRTDDDDLFMPELFLGFDLPDVLAEDWLGEDFDAAVSALLSFASSPAINQSYSDTDESNAETPAGALTSFGAGYEPTYIFDENDQLVTSGLSQPEPQPMMASLDPRAAPLSASGTTAEPAAPAMMLAEERGVAPASLMTARADEPRVMRMAPARQAAPVAAAPAMLRMSSAPPATEESAPRKKTTGAPVTTRALRLARGPSRPAAVQPAYAPMLLGLRPLARLPSEPPRPDIAQPTPRAARSGTAEQISTSSTGLMLMIGMIILVTMRRRRSPAPATDKSTGEVRAPMTCADKNYNAPPAKGGSHVTGRCWRIRGATHRVGALMLPRV